MKEREMMTWLIQPVHMFGWSSLGHTGELLPIDTVLQVEKAQSSTGENVLPAAPSEHPGHVLWNMEFIPPQARV